MIEIPEEIKKLFRSDRIKQDTKKYFKLTFYNDSFDALYPYETLFPDESLFPSEHSEPWLVIENNRIESESFSLTESLSETDDLDFGSCDSAMMEITVADVIEDVTGKEFVLSIGIGGYEMLYGMYTVDSFARQADRRKRKITAYDRMRKFDTDVSTWYNELNFPIQLKTFRDSLCDYIGIAQETISLPLDSMQIEKTIEPSELSGRDVLRMICQINGCFGHINKMGNLSYVFLQQTGLYPSEDLWPHEELYPSELGGDGNPFENIDYYKSMVYEDYLVDGITGVNIRQEEGDVGASAGDGGNPYIIEGNFLVYGKGAVQLLNIAQSILPMIYGRTYRPAQIECRCMPWVEVGDAVRAVTRDDLVDTFVMKRTIKGCQALMDNIESTGGKEREEVFGLNKEIIQLAGKTAIIVKNVEEVSVTISDLKKNTEAQLKVMSDSITAEVKRATDAEGTLSSSIKVEADRITAEVKRATDAEGTLSSSITQNAEQIALKVSKGDVSSQISVESKGVNITGNRLTWSATNSSMTANGTLTCNNIVATNGNFTGKITSDSATITGGIIEIGTTNSENVLIKAYTSTGWIGISPNSIIARKNYSDERMTLSSRQVSIGDSNEGSVGMGLGFGILYRENGKYATLSQTGISTNGMVVANTLSVTGAKARIINTNNFGEILQYCYETPSPMFGDIGIGKTDEFGTCYIYFDPIFQETVSADMEYQVFLQKEGEGDLWIKEKTEEYFVVCGTPNLAFCWEAKAKQRDYEYERLDTWQDPQNNDEQEIDYGNQAIAYLNNYEKEILEYEDTY